MTWRSTVVASLCVAALATSRVAPVAAHHSHANYDISTWTVLEGTVKQLVLMAPHSIVYLDVKDQKGAVATWALEATNQRTILNNGVKREDVRPGDQINRNVNPTQTVSYGNDPPVTGIGPAQPTFSFRTTDFWAQTLSVGFTCSF